MAPPLTRVASSGAALVVDDPDAPGETYVHWIVIRIAPRSRKYRVWSDSSRK